MPLLDVQGLRVEFRTQRGAVHAVNGVDLTLQAGQTVGLVGESGCGKSVTALAVLGLLPAPAGRVTAGSVLFEGRDLIRLREHDLQRVRGRNIAMVFQDPMTSLNPVMTVGKQLTEVLRAHFPLDRRQAQRRAVELLDQVGIPSASRRLDDYPHQFSGGMRQRVMVAMAVACQPKLLIADEPTTSLDVTIQAGILDLIRKLGAETGTAVMFITHDMGVVAQIADRVVVMRHGKRVETADTRRLFTAPHASYTRTLLAAVPRLGSGAPVYAEPLKPRTGSERDENPPDRVLDVKNLVTRFPLRKGPFRRLAGYVHAVEDVSFHIRHGETLGLVGESGSGKSTIGRSAMKLVQPTSGTIAIGGRDVTALGREAMRPVRKAIQMVFQDPYASLNPRMTVGNLITEPLAIHSDLSRADRRERAAELLRCVHLPPDSLGRYPHQFSGGQRQRLCIARALSSRPDIIVADEPVSALDVSVQARVIDLMRELQDEFGIAYLFISHDLAVIEKMSHRVAVLDQGRIVEMGPTDLVLADPLHAYTRELLAAIPVADPTQARRDQRALPYQHKSPIKPLGFVPLPMRYAQHPGERLVAEA